MRVLSRRTLREYWSRRPECEGALRAWFKEAEDADWGSPAEVKASYATASIIGDDRVVFNIRGNRHRLVVKINYAYRTVYIRFVGTHREYDRIDVETI